MCDALSYTRRLLILLVVWQARGGSWKKLDSRLPVPSSDQFPITSSFVYLVVELGPGVVLPLVGGGDGGLCRGALRRGGLRLLLLLLLRAKVDQRPLVLPLSGGG